MNLLYLAIVQSGAITSSVSQSVIDKAVDRWRTRLRACIKAKASHHFEHLLYTSADFRYDLTGFLEPLTDFRGRLQNRSFLWLMFFNVV